MPHDQLRILSNGVDDGGKERYLPGSGKSREGLLWVWLKSEKGSCELWLEDLLEGIVS